VTIANGVFSGIPNCTLAVEGHGVNFWNPTTATEIQIHTYDPTNGVDLEENVRAELPALPTGAAAGTFRLAPRAGFGRNPSR
jgi:hypothetical protein